MSKNHVVVTKGPSIPNAVGWKVMSRLVELDAILKNSNSIDTARWQARRILSTVVSDLTFSLMPTFDDMVKEVSNETNVEDQSS